MKKFLAILVALMLVASCMSAMAATITLTTLEGHTYEIFQVFTGTVDQDGKTLTELKYGASAKTGTAGQFVSPTDLAALKTIEEKNLTDEHAIIAEYSPFVDFSKPIDTKVQGTASIELDPGFYVIRDKDDKVPEGKDTDTTTLYMFQVLDKNFSSSAKAGTVEAEKHVDDQNDSDTSDHSELKDSADYDIGDTIPYTLTFKLPENYDKFEKYYVKFSDTISSGLTLNADSVQIQYGSGAFQKIEFSGEGTYTYEIADLKDTAPDMNAGDVITIKYTCYLNDNAVIGAAGNPNTYTVKFSNNPNKSGDGTPETGDTPEDKNIVFTYKTVFNKIDENEDPLTGADFTLYKVMADNSEVDVTTLNTSAHPAKIGTSAGSKFEFKGLDAGKYKLVESTTPKGYNTIDPIEFTITAEHDLVSSDPRLTSLLGAAGADITMTRNTSDEDGLTTSIMNKSGAVLPSTGGIGTTIFYVAGSILVLAAVILLVTKRRMNANND